MDDAKALCSKYPGVPDSMDKQTPLMGRIEAMNGLIDQIVYRLWAD